MSASMELAGRLVRGRPAAGALLIAPEALNAISALYGGIGLAWWAHRSGIRPA